MSRGLLNAGRAPGPADWEWAREFMNEPATRSLLRLLEDETVNLDNHLSPGDLEGKARAICVRELRSFRRATLAEDEDMAWRHLLNAEKAYEILRNRQSASERIQADFLYVIVVTLGKRAYRLLEDPVFSSAAALGGLNADQIRESLHSIAQASHGAKRKGYLSPLKKTLTALVSALEDDSTDAVLDELEWDAEKKPERLKVLRDAGKADVYFVKVKPPHIYYTVNCRTGQPKRVTIRRVENILSEARQEKNQEDIE